jgi:hypothetical protein
MNAMVDFQSFIVIKDMHTQAGNGITLSEHKLSMSATSVLRATMWNISLTTLLIFKIKPDKYVRQEKRVVLARQDLA